MLAAVRYTWMFRTAAVVFLFFGGVWLWRFGFTDYHVEQRPYGLAGGLHCAHGRSISCSGVRRVAIGVSASRRRGGAAFPRRFLPLTRHGPAILFLAGLAIVCCIYAVLAARVLTERKNPADEQ